MRTLVTKTWTFDAAHHLPNHDGKCQRHHGHTYAVTVGVIGEPAPCNGQADEGMVIDFARLDEVWAGVKAHCDHHDLNQSLHGLVSRTTCELLAEWVYDYFADMLEPDAADIEVALVRVSETPSTYAEVRG